jgi:DNA-binding response OmpR family regulator
LILDVRMPGASGLDLQRHLAQSGNPKPIIFLTGHGDIPMTVQAMKAGAVDFLTKPVRDQTLLDAVVAGVGGDTRDRLICNLGGLLANGGQILVSEVTEGLIRHQLPDGAALRA